MKIMLLTAATGGGHMRASAAVENISATILAMKWSP